jgi:hypothetical protein
MITPGGMIGEGVGVGEDAVGLAVGEAVGVGLALGLTVEVMDGVAVEVGVGLDVGVALVVGVALEVGVAVAVGVGVGVGQPPFSGAVFSAVASSTPFTVALAWKEVSHAPGERTSNDTPISSGLAPSLHTRRPGARLQVPEAPHPTFVSTAGSHVIVTLRPA